MNFSGPLVNLIFYINMNAYHLLKAEVSYELKVRNLSTEGSAGECRKRLYQGLSANTPIDVAVVNELNIEEELEECEGKYQDLSTLVSDYEGDHRDNEYHRLVARLWHLYLRVERIPIGATADDIEQSKTTLLDRCKELLDSFQNSPPLEDKDSRSKPANLLDQDTKFELPRTPSRATRTQIQIAGVAEDDTNQEKDTHRHEDEGEEEIILQDQKRILDHHRWEEEKCQAEEGRRKEERIVKQRRYQEERLRQEENRLQEEKRKQEERWKNEERRLQEARKWQEERWKQSENLYLRRPQQENQDRPQHEEFVRPRLGRSADDHYLTSVLPTQEESQISSRPKYVPVYKWGLKFDNTGPSIAAFLERVEELRRARGVTHQELYESAVDLFAGSALVWYRAASARIQSWHQLTRELREVFQPADYDIRLYQEIFNRLQGENEPIDLYIAAMEGLYSRLSVAVPDSTRLAQIYHNLHPQLQDRLALCDIQTLEQLRSMGRRAEAGRLSMVRPRLSTRRDATLEPDLAYQESNRRRGFSQGQVAILQPTQERERREITCWNCRDKGHRFRFCRQPKKKFCFGCGQDNVLKRDCIKCRSKNGQSRESEAN